MDKEGKQLLETSQKAWLAYRDAQCNGIEGYLGSQAQGAGAALILKSCLSEKLSKRITELKNISLS